MCRGYDILYMEKKKFDPHQCFERKKGTINVELNIFSFTWLLCIEILYYIYAPAGIYIWDNVSTYTIRSANIILMIQYENFISM